MPVQLQQWRARDWEDDGCSQENQTGVCIMAGFGLETHAIGHEMSNHPSEKQSLANTTQRWTASRRLVVSRYLQNCSFTFLDSTVFTYDRFRSWSLVAVQKL